MAARDVMVARPLPYPAAPAAGVRDANAVDTGETARAFKAAGLLVLMTVGSFALWTVVPLGGLWVASQLSASVTQLGAAPALVAMLGIPLSMALGGKALSAVERRYLRLAGTARNPGVPAYRRSISDSRAGPQGTVLDRIMTVSVVVAVVALGGWFFLFAGSSLPG